MAAKKDAREYVTMECGTCKQKNYRTSKRMKAKGAKKPPGKLELKKFCSTCRVHTLHKERKK